MLGSQLIYVLLFVGILLFVAWVIYLSIQFQQSSYHKITGNSIFDIMADSGKYGEYLVYPHLRDAEANGAKCLFNLYIPKSDGQTTEIDILMIHSHGIFVFESKNYSGWIFGDDSHKNWYQTLPTGRRGKSHKSAFYNPVMQNRNHIKHLKNILGNLIPMHSIVVFSDECVLKSVRYNSAEAHVIHRRHIPFVINDICAIVGAPVLTRDQIDRIFESLSRFTHVDAAIKHQHVHNIKTPPPRQPKQLTFEEKIVEHYRYVRCPWCGSSLKLRTAAQGSRAGRRFMGCASYPHCKYILNIDESFFKNENQPSNDHMNA